ncbi:FAD-binding oxidoreductase [Pseudactinotalea suaedae]|uniref:FAD-binding oxidoreductase n=1 Tax=Pseudactinotalea suaedae TaxID=1524924 RepID=UPI0012E1CCDC|nr:FAD-dependent oxidoreductase [Pseudactinotalea suaedae]
MAELGIVVDLAATSSGAELSELAQAAERAGLDLVVVAGARDEAGGDEPADELVGVDPWTVATWVAAATTRIAIGVPSSTVQGPDPSDPRIPIAAVVDKARESLALLAGDRLVHDGWVVAPAGADADQVRSLAERGSLVVVVPVGSAAEVERVAALLPERPRSTRRAAVRARRRPGIAYEEIPPSLVESAIEPGDPGYRAVRSTYIRGGSPGLVLRPRSAAEVADALAFARRHRHLPLGIRSAGHGFSGRSTNDGGLVIDVGALSTIEVLDEDARLVRVGPGATWKQVAAALEPHGWALGSGDYGGVGVGGLATAGGIGLLGRAHGLTIDHLRAVSIVLADGTQIRASSHEHPDLFWAVRGAGANFGVVTEFEFEVDEVAEVGWAQLTFVTTDLEAALLTYGEAQRQAPRDTTVFLVTGAPQQGQSVIQLYGMVDSSDPDTIIARLNPFVAIGQLAQQQVVLTSYRAVMGTAADVGLDGHHGSGEPVGRSGFLPAMTPAFAREAAAALRGGRLRWFQLRAMGGAIADVPPEETAFSYRSPELQVTALGAFHAEIDEAWEPMEAHMDGLYLSFDTSPDPDRVERAFPPAVLTRLRELKRRYDPDGLFRDNFPLLEGARA